MFASRHFIFILNTLGRHAIKVQERTEPLEGAGVGSWMIGGGCVAAGG